MKNDKYFKNTINRKDRDAVPDVMIDATKMTDLDIYEMWIC